MSLFNAARFGPRVRRPVEDTPTVRRRRKPPVDEPAKLAEPISILDRLPRPPQDAPSRAEARKEPAIEAYPEPQDVVLETEEKPRPHVPDVVPVAPRRSNQVENVVPFRRRRAVRRLRRHPLVRWLQPFTMALLIVALPVVLMAWFLQSPRFALSEMQVTTGDRVSDQWVHERLAAFEGRNLLLLPLGHLERRLEQHPWVSSVNLRKEPPGRLHVQVHERREAALLRQGQDLIYLDTQGRPIVPFEPGDPTVDLVVISKKNPSQDPASALALLDELESAQVSWLSGLSEIDVLGQQDFKIFTTDLPFPLLVRAGTVDHKARRLNMLLPQIAARYGSEAAVDLRFARRIIVQPGPRKAPVLVGKALRNGVS